MDKKAQIAIGGIIIAAIGILVGLALYTGTFASSIGTMTKTQTATNVTVTMPANGATSELSTCGQKAITYSLRNATNTTLVPTNNYTITQGTAASDGYLIAKLSTVYSNHAGSSVNVTCEYEPRGYVSDGGGRAIVSLIAIFMALLIMVAALPNVRNGVMDFFRGR